MYLSALQRSILKKCLKNKRLENLSIDSDAIEKEVLSYKQKDQKIDKTAKIGKKINKIMRRALKRAGRIPGATKRGPREPQEPKIIQK